MQNKDFKGTEDDTINFSIILKKARHGDNQAMEKLISLFEDEISILCRYIKISKEDVVQELYTYLIFLVREGFNNGKDL